MIQSFAGTHTDGLLGGCNMKYEKPTLVKHDELKQVTFSSH